MFNYKIVKDLNYSDKQMFDLIIDVEKYPEFLPWCKSTNIYDKGTNIFYSDMEIGFNLIKYSDSTIFSSHKINGLIIFKDETSLSKFSRIPSPILISDLNLKFKESILSIN